MKKSLHPVRFVFVTFFRTLLVFFSLCGLMYAALWGFSQHQQFLRVMDRGQCALAIDQYDNVLTQGRRTEIPGLDSIEVMRLTPIDVSNTDEIVELERLGRGYVREAFWRADGSLYVLTSIGMWLHQSDNLEMPPELLWTYDMDIHAITVSPNRELFAIQNSYYTDTIDIWDTAMGDERITLQTGGSGTKLIAFNHQGTQIAVASRRRVYLYAISSGERVAEFTDFTGSITSLAFSNDDRLLAVGGSDQFTSSPITFNSIIRIWELTSSNLTSSIQAGQGSGRDIQDLAFSSDNNVLVSGEGYQDQNIRLWNIQDGQSLETWGSVSTWGRGSDDLNFTSDGRLLIYHNRVYDVNLNVLITTLANSYDGRFSPDDMLLVTRSSNNSGLIVWNTNNFSLELDLSNYYQSSMFERLEFNLQGTLYGLQTTGVTTVSTDGQHLALTESYPSDSDGVTFIRFCDVQQKKQAATFDGGVPMAFSQNNALLATTNYCGGSFSLWDGYTGEAMTTLASCGERRSRIITGLTFNTDASIVAIAVDNRSTGENTIEFWDINSRQLLSTLTGHTGNITGITFTNADRVLATSSTGTVRFWGVPQ